MILSMGLVIGHYWFVYISNYENNSDDKVSEKFIAIE